MTALPVFLVLCLASTGLSEPLHKRIINGNDAQRSSHPSIVSLTARRRSPTTGLWETAHTCGGTLIHREWVLTAAHCIDRIRRAGHGDVIIDGQSLKIDRWVVHPKYAYNPFLSIPNDIALIKLYTPAKLTDNVKIARLADECDSCEEFVLAGWGKDSTGNDPQILQEVKIRKISTSDCSQYYYKITEKHICVHDVNTPAASRPRACFGDGGSPMMCVSGQDQLLAGVSSFVQENCGGEAPSVYTRVSEYRDFIFQNARV